MSLSKVQRVPLWTKTFIGLTIVQFLLFLGFQMLLPTLPTYAASLGADEGGIGLVTGFFTLSATLVRPLAGFLTDRLGRRGIFLLGTGVFILSVMSYAFIFTLALMLVVRFIHGMSWGFSSTANETAASDNIPRERFGEGLGYFSLASSIAMATGPVLGIFFVNKFDYDVMFYVSAALCTGSMGISFLVKYKRRTKRLRTTTRVPFDKNSLRPAILMFFVAITFGTIISFLTVHTVALGIKNIGFFFTLFAIMMVIARPIWGLLIDRFGFNIAVIPGCLFLIVTMLILSQAERYSSFLWAAVCFGIGFAACHSSFQTLAIMSASEEKRGAANALFLTGFDGGLAIGAILFGFLAAKVGYGPMYLAATIAPMIAMVFYLLTNSRAKKIAASVE